MSQFTPSYSLSRSGMGIDGCRTVQQRIPALLWSNNTSSESYWNCCRSQLLGTDLFCELLNRRARRALMGFLLPGARGPQADNLFCWRHPQGGAVPRFNQLPACCSSPGLSQLRGHVQISLVPATLASTGHRSLAYPFSVIEGRLLLRFGTSAMFCVGRRSPRRCGRILWFFASADAYRAQRRFLPPPLLRGNDPSGGDSTSRFPADQPRYNPAAGRVCASDDGHTYMSNCIYQIVASRWK
jgi:PPP family 3-phenylpropionic acid transporter